MSTAASRPLKWLMLAAATFLGLSVAGGAFVADRSLHRPRQPITADDRVRARDLARALDARLDEVSIEAADREILRGWRFTPVRRPAPHTVLLLHGITSNRAAMLAPIRLLVEHGYRAIAIDARAHGESGGDLTTFGVREAGDLRRWIAFARGDRADACVFTIGQSMGAAVALQAADAPGLCGVIAEAGFASVREMTMDRIAQQLHAGLWVGRSLLRPGVESGFLYTRLRYGVDLTTASPVDAVARSGVPILAIHGMQDANTPPRHAALIHDANPARVSTWIVPGVSHTGALRAAPAEYAVRVLDFLARQSGARP